MNKEKNVLNNFEMSVTFPLGMEKITSKEAIALRDNLSVEIPKLWKTIRVENVVPIGVRRSQSMFKVLETIEKKAESRVAAKIALQSINMGLTDIKELSTNAIYPAIYWLNEYNEMLVQLDELKKKALIPAHMKKYSKNEEQLTIHFITKKRYDVARRINHLTAVLSEFNDTAALKLT